MVTSMPKVSPKHEGICKGCALGKNTKKSLPRSKSRSKGILDLIHSNICGPMSSPSLSGCLYYVLFIDDYSWKSWIYFLKAKSETFDRFKEFKTLIENQTGRHIRILISDNEGEYESNDFDDFCREAGIKKELTVAYNPQQNGAAERKNRTICEAAKAMITEATVTAV